MRAAMTWNAYYRDKMNRLVGIWPIRMGDANFPTTPTYFRGAVTHPANPALAPSLAAS